MKWLLGTIIAAIGVGLYKNMVKADGAPPNSIPSSPDNSVFDNNAYRNTSLGLYNNNLLNLRPVGLPDKWRGQVAVRNTAVGPFAVFASLQWGVRCACVNISYWVSRGDTTISKLIYRWAPPNDPYAPNPTEHYVKTVAQNMGVNRDSTILLNDDAYMAKLIRAMSKQELGENFSAIIPDSVIAEGIQYWRTNKTFTA